MPGGMNMRERIAEALRPFMNPELVVTGAPSTELAAADAVLDALAEPDEGMIAAARKRAEVPRLGLEEQLTAFWQAMLAAARKGE